MKQCIAVGVIATVCCCLLGCRERQGRPQTLPVRNSIAAIQTAVQMYEVVHSEFPDSLEQLTASDGEIPAFLKTENLIDSWGTPFRYTKIDRFTYEIRSAGLDKIMNTEDDLTN